MRPCFVVSFCHWFYLFYSCDIPWVSSVWVLLPFYFIFRQVTPRDVSLCVCTPHFLFDLIAVPLFPPSVFLLHCVSHSSSLPLSSFLWVVLGCLYDCLCCVACGGGCISCPKRIIWLSVFSFVSFSGNDFLCRLLSCPLYSRFNLFWLRLSCVHGWIRSGSVNNVI